MEHDSEAKAKEYFARAVNERKEQLKHAEKAGDKNNIGSALSALGYLYDQLGESKKAVAHLKKRLKMAEASRDKAAESRACCNLGNAYRYAGKLDKVCKSLTHRTPCAYECGRAPYKHTSQTNTHHNTLPSRQLCIMNETWR